ncbi:hypothetical protein C8A05DRAFT_37025 [Staphylotrichum tortipilum]|uniref:Uncharacterized protein n=1 Tax=Staphylotrichum tortipilum TaxID=2831512 RepID=A0AAN6MEI9_9PEZI|nr:hypothetical protein C8A05DRAFT_37025 [Staphylotrichum longicolle]
MSLPSSPAGGGQPLQPVSHNAQRDSALFASAQNRFADSASHRDSSVHEKITQFNTMAMQSKQHERKTAEAALKRAVLGREEAEAEVRRCRDEMKMMKKLVDDGKDRERRVGERLETVMDRERMVRERLDAVTDNYERAKETHLHTKQLWEKEIRRARKDTFKAQSELVKAQEELKSCRMAQKAAEEELQAERDRIKTSEQDAFNAQCNMAGLQEELAQAQARANILAQELDALKTLAKNDAEFRRLAARDAALADRTDEDGPRKRPRVSSETDDAEINTLRMMWEWEKQRADRALDQVDFLEAECQLKACSAAKSLRASASASSRSSSRRKRTSDMITDASDEMILSESRRVSAEAPRSAPRRSKTDLLRGEREPRRSTIFLPAEGIFRTVSQAEADALTAAGAATALQSPTESALSAPITPTDSDPMYRRTPSVEPPDFAMMSKERTSLLSLLDAPHRQDPTPVFNIPTTPGPNPDTIPTEEDDDSSHPNPDTITPHPESPPSTTTVTTTTITTKIPLRPEPTATDPPTLAQRLLQQQRTPSRNGETTDDPDKPSFDASNPALTPTMTREEALAQIRERRGRARSVGRVGSGGTTAATSSGGATGAASARSSGGAKEGKEGEGRKVSGGQSRPGSVMGGRKVSGGGERGREVTRREVSVPGSGAAGAKRGVSGVRRVRT